MKLRRNCSIIVFLIISMLFISCSNHNKKEYKTPDQFAKELQAEVMECFVNNDKDKLKQMFSYYTMENTHNIDQEINEAFDFMDGKIISYDEPISRSAGNSDNKSYGAYTDNILTDKGSSFKIGFTGWLTNDNSSSMIGITYIQICKINSLQNTNQNSEENDIKYIGYVSK